MTRKTIKLPPAKDWQARDIEDWNTTTFCAYLTDLHAQLFGIDYVPMRSWAVERGLLGNLIGTAGKNAKPRKASNDEVKAFIDLTFRSYKPSADWPGTSFGFMWTYRKSDWQRVQAEHLQRERQAEVGAVPAQKNETIDESWW